MKLINKRRRFLRDALALTGAVTLAGCDKLSETSWAPKVLGSATSLSHAAQRTLSRNAMATEYDEADISPEFRPNGSTNPQAPAYRALAANGFRDYELAVGGLVAHPLSLSLADLRALPNRTQITRHDCVEGWSVIGKWTGVQLSRVLKLAQPTPAARYVVFRCYDAMDDGTEYYESLGFDDANHPQTLLAWALNDKTLPIPNGAPLRLRVPRQLGYKMAKYLRRIDLVASLKGIEGGHGGYWEDQGYQWYAGI
ncbi:MAG TPA: molybdopterin-binding protein [Rhodanobacteraceae bacterium]|jgi:DMSO/TMAO reductase YedYZ molybdopterin-dependent catalytic subunit|nr:molybdopterin-binding protein [Rhodanobacteraceae bacterium]